MSNALKLEKLTKRINDVEADIAKLETQLQELELAETARKELMADLEEKLEQDFDSVCPGFKDMTFDSTLAKDNYKLNIKVNLLLTANQMYREELDEEARLNKEMIQYIAQAYDIEM